MSVLPLTSVSMSQKATGGFDEGDQSAGSPVRLFQVLSRCQYGTKGTAAGLNAHALAPYFRPFNQTQSLREPTVTTRMEQQIPETVTVSGPAY